MITKNDVVTLVKTYLQTNDLTAFSHSFAELFYDIDQTGDDEAIQLANELEGLLAAMTAGVANAAEFSNVLKALINAPAVTVVVKEMPVSEGQVILAFFTAAAAGSGGATVTFEHVDTASSAGFLLTVDPQALPQTSTDLPLLQPMPAAL